MTGSGKRVRVRRDADGTWLIERRLSAGGGEYRWLMVHRALWHYQAMNVAQRVAQTRRGGFPLAA